MTSVGGERTARGRRGAGRHTASMSKRERMEQGQGTGAREVSIIETMEIGLGGGVVGLGTD